MANIFRIIPHWIKTGQGSDFREFTVGELPRCTQFLSYQQMLWPGHDGLYGTFGFEAVHLSRAVYKHLRNHASVTDPDLDLFEWLRGRDRECVATTSLPPAWRGIEIMVLNGVIEPSRFEVWCHACRHLYTPEETTVPPPRECIGSIYSRLTCPADHLLSRIEVMHIH